jgi:hypothetical protein
MLSPFSFRPFLWDSGKLNFVHRFKALVSSEKRRISGFKVTHETELIVRADPDA